MSPRHPRNEKAFTLLEVLITAVIISVITSIAVPAVNHLRNSGSQSAAAASTATLVDEFQLAYTLGRDVITNPSPTITDGAIPVYQENGQQVTRPTGDIQAIKPLFKGDRLTCLSTQQGNYISTWTENGGLTTTSGTTLGCADTGGNDTGGNGSGGTGAGGNDTEGNDVVDDTPSAPLTLNAQAISANAVVLGIGHPASDGTSEIIRYQYRLSTSQTWVDLNNASGPFTVYRKSWGATATPTIYVRAINGSGAGTDWAKASATLTDPPSSCSTPTAPLGLSTKPLGNGEVRLTWLPPACIPNELQNPTYTVKYGSPGNWTTATSSLPLTDKSYTISDLNVGDTYQFTIAVNTGSGSQGLWSGYPMVEVR